MTVRAMITRYVSREGVRTSRAGLLPLLRLEKGFQTVWRSGPGYDEERVRPVLALIVCGRPRLFLVRGVWSSGRFGQYYVPRGTDHLRPTEESDVAYFGQEDAPDAEGFPDWNDAVAAAPKPPSPEEEPANFAFDLMMNANRKINTVVYEFLGRASNDQMFRGDDFKLAEPFAAAFEREPNEFHRSLRDQTAGGLTVSLINRLIAHLEYLRDVYSADRETIKAWRSERLEAFDALAGLTVGLNHDHEAYQASPEYMRWQAIRDVGALEYPLSPEELARRAKKQERRPGLTPQAPLAVPASVHEKDG